MKGLSWRVYNAGIQRIAQVGAYAITIQAADLRQGTGYRHDFGCNRLRRSRRGRG
jgi:hypothetical protein